MSTEREVTEFLEEAKSMLEMNGYHKNIVNLQGITYKTGQHRESSIEVRFARVSFKKYCILTFLYQKLSLIRCF